MLRLLLDCEVVTPMFVGGAYPNKAAELRVPSFRGALRWWYRALLAGQGVSSVDDLKKQEAAVFGSTDQVSKVRVTLLDAKLKTEKYKKISRLKDGTSGTSYLWYYVHAGTNERRYIKPNQRFVLLLQALPTDREALEEAVRALWLLSYLGGVGTRSRRMAGSFAVRVVDNQGDVRVPSFAPTGSFSKWLATELNGLLSHATSPLAEDGIAILHPQTTRVGCVPGGRGPSAWADTVEAVGALYKDFRDQPNVKTPQKAAMGLPLATGRSGNEQVVVISDGTELERRASPLWLQAAKDADGNVVGIATAFTSPFAPPPVHIRGGGSPDKMSRVAELFFDLGRLESVL